MPLTEHLTLTKPDDFHLHLRDGEMLRRVVADSARRFGRAIIMPNLRTPITTTELARQYRDRILASVPGGLNFQPLMTLFLTDEMSPVEIGIAKASGIIHGVKWYPAGATTNAEHGVRAITRCYNVLAGTRGLGKWEQFFVGSTAKRLIRKCPSSVWIVKAGHICPPKVVLAATDFSDVSLKAVKEGRRVAQQASAEFHLLHVVDSKDVPEDLISRIPKGSSLRQEINEEATRRLEEFLDSLAVDRTQIQVHLSWGTPWQEIRRISRHQAADLIVIGTVGRSGIKGLLLGNTAEKVLDTCDCSILTVKPDGFVSPI